MKVLKYIFIILGIFLASCADDSIHELGKIDLQFEESYVTATNAIIEVSIPHPDTNSVMEVMSISLVKKKTDNASYDYDRWYAEYNEGIKGSEVVYLGESPHDGRYIFQFNHLTPSTEYYVVVGCLVNYNLDNKGVRTIYFTDHSITTKPEGDYSALGKAICGYSRIQRNEVVLEAVLPDNLVPYNAMTLYASENKDMSDARFKQDYGLSFKFPSFPKRVFYFQLKGDVRLFIDGNVFAHYYDVTIDVEDTIDFKLLYEYFGIDPLYE